MTAETPTSDGPDGPEAPLPRRRTGSWRRRLGAGARLVAALALLGGLYTAFAPSVQAEELLQEDEAAAARKGRQLYEESCITCHGNNAEGVPGRGPSLIGVGAAAVEFQVTSGRMPMARQEAQAPRKPPVFTEDEARQLAAYIQQLGGGPRIPDGDLRDGDQAKGGELFRINCASCHTFGGNGIALSSGKYAPGLKLSTDRQMYAAMLTGPQNMPVFGDNQLTPQEKRDIIAYVQNMKEDQQPGGWGLGKYGPAPEGLVIFVVGMVGLVLATLWIAGKS